MEAHAFGFRFLANGQRPEGKKRFPISRRWERCYRLISYCIAYP